MRNNSFFKFFKFLISMIIILSMILPSYASLTSSDGSSFVTKAEFDSALADFNSRLTTFEAGINSKIDSQVTSYLDRNGIWSAKNQTIALASIENATGRGSSEKAYTLEQAWGTTQNWFGSWLQSVDSQYSKLEHNADMIWCQSINKSGLCVVSGDIQCQSSDGRMGGNVWYRPAAPFGGASESSNRPYAHACPGLTGKLILYTYHDGNMSLQKNYKYSYNFYQFDFTYWGSDYYSSDYAGSGFALQASIPTGMQCWSFFVSKNDRLCSMLKCEVTVTASNSKTFWFGHVPTLDWLASAGGSYVTSIYDLTIDVY